MPMVSMSRKEFDRLEVLLGVQSGRLRIADACELLSLKRRQVFRLLAGLKHGGAASLVSERRGRPTSNVCLRRVVIWRCRWFGAWRKRPAPTGRAAITAPELRLRGQIPAVPR